MYQLSFIYNFFSAWAQSNSEASDAQAQNTLAMDTGNPWDNPPKQSSAEPVATGAISIPSAEEGDSKLMRSSTPPEGGWANFGEFNEDSKDGMEATTTTVETSKNKTCLPSMIHSANPHTTGSDDLFYFALF